VNSKYDPILVCIISALFVLCFITFLEFFGQHLVWRLLYVPNDTLCGPNVLRVEYVAVLPSHRFAKVRAHRRGYGRHLWGLLRLGNRRKNDGE